MKTKKAKIAPLSVWIVGHPQNPLIAGDSDNGPRAVFYNKKEATAWRKANHDVYALQRATIIRDGSGPDYKAQRDAAEAEMMKAKAERDDARAELAALEKKVSDGKIWNVENARITPRAQAAIALAHKEAQAAGATYIGTEHLLLGLLKQGEGIAHRHFLAAGMTYDKAEYAMRVGRCS